MFAIIFFLFSATAKIQKVVLLNFEKRNLIACCKCLLEGINSALSQASFRMPQLYAGTKHSKSFKKEKKSKQQTLSSHLHHKNAKLPIWPTAKECISWRHCAVSLTNTYKMYCTDIGWRSQNPTADQQKKKILIFHSQEILTEPHFTTHQLSKDF